jgi:hypothetical protein
MSPNAGGGWGVSANEYNCTQEPKLTINVPVVYMGQYKVVLRGTIHNKGHFRGGP